MLSWEKKRQVCRTFKQPTKINNTALLCLVTGLSFLCTFVPGSEKTIERTFAPVELSFSGTFAPGERKVQELSFHGTFAPVELSLLRSECSKNFRSMELSHPWNFRSSGANVPRTFVPRHRCCMKMLT